jgi:PEP-CTERM motif
MQRIVAALLVLMVAGSVKSSAQISQIFPDGYSVTGVRASDASGNMIIAGGTGTSPFFYSGPLPSSTNPGNTYTSNLVPIINGNAIMGTSTFYGPNTPYYDSSIGAGNVLAVGSYKETSTSTYQDGMMYLGPITGSTNSSNWTPIKVTESVAGQAVGDTIPHSTMGNLVVGNYNTAVPSSGQGFIYNISAQSYKKLSFGDVTSAFGIWQNGGSTSSLYTIVGGYTLLGGNTQIGSKGQVGYIVNYDASTDVFSSFTELSLNNDRSIFTHVEGIAAYENGFSLATMSVQGGLLSAAYAFVPVTTDGFGVATWNVINNNLSGTSTTGDTVIDTSVMGLYTTTGGASASFVYSVPEPSALSLLAVGIGGLVMMRRRRS